MRNPWDPTRISGGSSSGSAALVATGEVDLAFGGDQGGSVRMPERLLRNRVGHKPTYGLVPYTGAFPIERTIDHLGPMTRTVADAALMLSVLAGPDGLDSRQTGRTRAVDYVDGHAEPATTGLRVGVVTEGFGTAVSDPAVDAAVRAAIEQLRSAGMTVEEVSIPWHTDAMACGTSSRSRARPTQMIEGNAYGMNAWELFDPELIEFYGRQRIEAGPALSKTVKVVGMTGRHMIDHDGGKHYAMARCLAYELRAAYDEALSRFDVLVDADAAVCGVGDPRPGRVAGRLPRGRRCPCSATPHRSTSPATRPAACPQGSSTGLPDRTDDRRQAFRRRHRAARRPPLRTGRRRASPCRPP